MILKLLKPQEPEALRIQRNRSIGILLDFPNLQNHQDHLDQAIPSIHNRQYRKRWSLSFWGNKIEPKKFLIVFLQTQKSNAKIYFSF